MSGLILVYLVGYWAATRITLARGPAALVATETALDRFVPYIPGSWPLYWIAYPFVIGGGGLVLLRLPDRSFRRALIAIAGMTVFGSLVQIVFPARAPWPPDPAASQRLFHDSALILPFATLPSMHVAYCAVTVGLVHRVVPGRLTLVLGLALVLIVAVATLLLREHVILDAVTGLALAGATTWWWRRGGA